MSPSIRTTLTGIAATGLVVGGSLVFVASAAGAQESTPAAVSGKLLLHNDIAEVDPDCPADGLAYWHFVFAPNDDTASFETISLELATQPEGSEVLTFSGAAIVPNKAQTDNVFVAVPAGHTLDDIILGEDSWATYTGSESPSKFNLSHLCEGRTPPTTVPETTTTTAPPEVLGTTTLAPTTTVAAEVEGEVQVNGELPYTGQDNTGLFVAGLSVLAGGSALVLMARKKAGAA